MRKAIALALIALASLAAFASRGNGGAVRGAAARAASFVCNRYEAEVEYLQSSGTQYINTGVTSQNNLVYDFDTYESPNNNQCQMFGFTEGSSWLSTGVNNCNWGEGWFYVDFANSETRIYNSIVTTRPRGRVRYHFEFINGSAKFTANGTQLWASSSSGSYNGTRKVYLFWMDATARGGKWVGRIYSASVKKNGELLCDLIPVRVGSVGYMYDRVSGKLFGNAGTGAFIVGPDK